MLATTEVRRDLSFPQRRARQLMGGDWSNRVFRAAPVRQAVGAYLLYNLGVCIRELGYELDVFAETTLNARPPKTPDVVRLETAIMGQSGLLQLDNQIAHFGSMFPIPKVLQAIVDLRAWYENATRAAANEDFGLLIANISNSMNDIGGIVRNEMQEINLWFIGDSGDFSATKMLDRGPHLTREQLDALPENIRRDILQAGRCLVVRASTAVGFHLFRALETTTLLYFPLLGLSRQAKGGGGVRRDWNSYIEAIAGRDKNGNRITGEPVGPLITDILHHIRDKYRNPVTHDEETWFFTPAEANDFVSLAMSAIRMMADDIIARRKARGA